MRHYLLLGVASVSLAACGGAGPETVSSAPAPVVGTAADPYTQFVKPTEAKTFVGVGGTQRYVYTTDDRIGAGQQGQLYAGNASTVRDSGISIAYDPRDAIFTLKISDGPSGVAIENRFQDPAHRTDFGGAVQPQWGAPDLTRAGGYSNANIQYLQSGSGTGTLIGGSPTRPVDGLEGATSTATTLFYEKPGSTTKYVSLAGYVRNNIAFTTVPIGDESHTQNSWTLERGAFAYGMLTDNAAVPTSGTASYTGNMLATMVANPTIDDATSKSTYFQWLSGTAKTTVDFGAKSVQLALQGVVLAPQVDRYTVPATDVALPQNAFIVAGSTFAASGKATIDLVNKGGFAGSFEGGSFVFSAPAGTTFADGSATSAVNVVGSSIDGAFYGPKANEIGGGFRVVGGTPDQRVDILGAFTGKQ